MIQHFPVLAVMLLFLAAFCVEIFGSHNAGVRNTIVMIAATVAMVLIYALIKPVMIEGQIISYWMGNWEPPIGIEFAIDPLNTSVLCMITFIALVVSFYSLYWYGRRSGYSHYDSFPIRYWRSGFVTLQYRCHQSLV